MRAMGIGRKSAYLTSASYLPWRKSRAEHFWTCPVKIAPLKSPSYSATEYRDGGQEGPGIYGTINMARGIGNSQPIIRRAGDNLVIANWIGWGRPNRLVEPGMQWVATRQSVNIWHKTEIWFTCQGGEGKYRIVSFSGSKFPSHKLWVNGGREQKHNRQGAFSDLWYGQFGQPTFVR